MKNALYVLAASILISALALCWSIRTAAPAAPEDRQAEARAQIRDMVLAREAIPADYLRYLDQDLAAQAEEYNLETANLKSQYTVYAKEQIHGMFEYYRDNEPERLNYFASEKLICEAAAHLVHCALYRNPQELYYEDPAMAYALSGEEGGSGGLWAEAVHLLLFHKAIWIGRRRKPSLPPHFDSDNQLDRKSYEQNNKRTTALPTISPATRINPI